MKLLKYESFLETMQFSVLTNAQRLAKQEADRKAKQELTSTKETPKTIDTNDDYGQGAEEMPQEAAEEMDTTEDDEEMDTTEDDEDTDF